MDEGPPDTVACRLCASSVAREAKICPSCGAKEPWIPDEPTINPRVIRVAMWVGGALLLVLLLVMSGILMFAPSEGERDHRPPAADSEAHKSR